MSELETFNGYMTNIVEPTFMDYHVHPSSTRLAFLACVAVYHSIDRFERHPGNLRKEWGKKSLMFLMVDMIAHHFKHVQSNQERHKETPPNTIPLRYLVFNDGVTIPNSLAVDHHNLYFVIRDAITFVKEQAQQRLSQCPTAKG
ncbi:MAG: hypothetical protein P8011_08820 [Acidihalobacter sp.]|uniref:hypothetical protein n=1 Tax=Acidihalobacter sp. TaxID=1872108 RepID=UPI00307DA086